MSAITQMRCKYSRASCNAKQLLYDARQGARERSHHRPVQDDALKDVLPSGFLFLVQGGRLVDSLFPAFVTLDEVLGIILRSANLPARLRRILGDFLLYLARDLRAVRLPRDLVALG